MSRRRSTAPSPHAPPRCRARVSSLRSAVTTLSTRTGVPLLSRVAICVLLAATPPLVPCALAQPAAGQPAAPRFGRPTLRALAGLAFGTAYAEDANGTTVSPGLAPLVSVEGASRVGARTALTLSLRASRPGATVEFEGAGSREVEGGGVTTVDVVLGAERLVHDLVAVRGGVGLLYLKGPEALAPFRFNNASSVRPLLDLGGDVRLTRRYPLSASVAWQGFRYGAATVADPIDEAGLVQRWTVGVRYGR